MNYNKHYNNLIIKAKNRKYQGYTETHHILPKCMGGNDEISNLVELTPEEHYVAHQLLIKIYPENQKLVHAAMMMCASRKGNKVYGWLRKRLSTIQKIRQAGQRNSQYGTCWIHKNNKSMKISQSQLNYFLEDGWERGRQKKETTKKEKIARGIYSDKYKWILEQENEILKEFEKYKSINYILSKRGFKNREGNTILSRFLKSKGKDILRRRNSAGVA